jgi:hypothetical protein
MDTLGFNIRTKFRTLEVKDWSRDQLQGFIGELRTFSGLVLYHGNPFRPITDGTESVLKAALMPVALTGRCAVLVVDTEVFKRPSDCASSFVHFYSVSVANRTPNPFEFLFRQLVDKFKGLHSLPTEEGILALWTQVDPYQDRLALLRRMEEVLYAQKSEQEGIPREIRKSLGPYYGERLETYQELRTEYVRLCDQSSLKKN